MTLDRKKRRNKSWRPDIKLSWFLWPTSFFFFSSGASYCCCCVWSTLSIWISLTTRLSYLVTFSMWIGKYFALLSPSLIYNLWFILVSKIICVLMVFCWFPILVVFTIFSDVINTLDPSMTANCATFPGYFCFSFLNIAIDLIPFPFILIQ